MVVATSTTVTLVSGTLPQLVTVPPKNIFIAGEATGATPAKLQLGNSAELVEHVLVTQMRGLVQTKHVALSLAQTVTCSAPPPTLSVPHATIVSVNGPQRFPKGA